MTDDLEHFNDLELELATLLRRFRAYSARAAREIDPDLEFGSYGLLIRIMEAGSIRASDLAEHMAVGKPTVTRQLNALEERGLIERLPNESDARSSLVALTDYGYQRVERIRSAGRKRLRDSLSDWERREVASLADELAKLNRSLSGPAETTE